jgi:hypothetical protein
MEMRSCQSGQSKGGKFRRLPMMKISGTAFFAVILNMQIIFFLELGSSFFIKADVCDF